jgi:hypothetical protein
MVRANPLLGYTPHPKQVQFHKAPTRSAASSEATSPARRRPAASTARSTRSRRSSSPLAGHYKRWPWETEFYGRIVVVDLVQALEGVMLPKLRKILPKGALWKGDFDKAYNSRRRRLQFANGNWWEFLTHDMEVDQFAGGTLHFIWYDEEPPGNKGRRSTRRTSSASCTTTATSSSR